MSLDRGMPGRHPLGRPVIFGNPKHGPVQGGSITLPTGVSLSYPQPDGAWPDQAGATHLLRRPGYPVVVRTEEQAEADAMAGYQWRNQAMLSGGRQQLYGKHLDGWVYIDPDGNRWWIKITTSPDATFAFVSSLSLDFEIRRFGEFGLVAAGSTVTKTLAEWGQQGIDALQGFDLVGGVEAVVNARLVIDAITSNGAKVALCVHTRRTTSSSDVDSTIDVAVRHPLGWLQIEVSMVGGIPVLAMTVLKDRSQTLVILENERDGYPDQVILPPLIAGGPELWHQPGSSGFVFDFRRLAGVWSDPDTGEWRWLSVRCRHEGVSESSISTVGSAYVQEVLTEFDQWYAMEVDGAEAYRLSTSRATGTQNSFTYAVHGVGASLTLGTLGLERSVVIDGVEYAQEFGPGGGPTFGSGSITSWDAGPGYTNMGVTYYNFGGVELLSIVYRSLWRHEMWAVLSSPEPYQLRVDFDRQSPQVVGLRMHLLSASASQFTYWPRATPSGAAGEKESRAFSSTERLYGSWCPHTEQAKSMETEPVCWV